MKKFLMMLALSGGLVLSACNTLHGAANDVESTTDCVDGIDNNCGVESPTRCEAPPSGGAFSTSPIEPLHGPVCAR